MGCVSAKKRSEKGVPMVTGASVSPAITAANSQRPPVQWRQEREQRTQPVAISQRSVANSASEAPVAAILQKTQAQLRAELEEEREDVSIHMESPARYPKRKNSMDLKAEQQQAHQEIMRVSSADKEPQLPVIKDMTTAKSNFDRDKFRKANEGILPPLSSLPLSVQARLDEVQMFGAVDDRSAKPLSSLALLTASNPIHPSNRSLENYVSSRIASDTDNRGRDNHSQLCNAVDLSLVAIVILTSGELRE